MIGITVCVSSLNAFPYMQFNALYSESGTKNYFFLTHVMKIILNDLIRARILCTTKSYDVRKRTTI